ncbi:UNVERIFIED_CONTAM: hypothetical protein Sradi_6194500 [Sesamum radiatum]|uniref:Uncharacterized protein n=1 Tax=Sesamum radiatum TaxID=300843 RepID=A0AAW2KA35_SESRA
MSHCGEPLPDVQALTPFLYSSVVGYYFSGDSKTAYYIFPDEFHYFSFSYACQGLSFDPFSEIVNGHQKELPLTRSQREIAYNVHPPLYEGAGGQHCSQGFCWLMYERGMLLASLALAYYSDRILLHG